MKKTILLISALIISFGFGFAFKTVVLKYVAAGSPKKVTGIGGVFFKCKDPKQINAWYKEHLGIETSKYGAVFRWYEGFDSTKKAATSWNPFSEKTKYFEPSTKDFMLNYRVENLTALAADLKKEGVTIVDTIETSDYGKFLHIMDIEGNKIELWEQTGSN